MARSKLPNPTVDLVSDSGAVLFSLVQGEQLLYPAILDGMLPENLDVTATIIEAFNIPLQTDKPTTALENGKRTDLTIQVPQYRGDWNAIIAYASGQLVHYEGAYYLRDGGPALDSTPPPDSDLWVESGRGQMHILLPETLSRDWTVQPSVGSATYGFIEVAVSERGGSFPRRWKPIRGMIEFLFSPTLQ